MKNKILTATLALGLALSVFLVLNPVIAHPYWESEDEEQVYPPWMEWNENYTMPYWDENSTYYMPHWNENRSLGMPYWTEDGEYCLGPYEYAPDGDAPYGMPHGDDPQEGYGCGESSGGMMGRGYGGMMGRGYGGMMGGGSRYGGRSTSNTRGFMVWSN